MKTRLSFPPLASCWPVADHLRPHISWVWALYVVMIWDRTLTSLLMIKLSIPPVVRMWLFQSSEPTLDMCPSVNVISCLERELSQIKSAGPDIGFTTIKSSNKSAIFNDIGIPNPVLKSFSLLESCYSKGVITNGSKMTRDFLSSPSQPHPTPEARNKKVKQFLYFIPQSVVFSFCRRSVT